jgi:glycosyltransferase involved in cell wall biosynthesis
MKVGIAGPISLRMLAGRVTGGDELPEVYSFPFIAQLALALLNAGHEVSVFALSQETRTRQLWSGAGLTVHVCPMRPRARHRALDLFARERVALREAMVQDPCDVIHAHWTYEFALAALASGRPTLISAHDAPWRVLRHMPNAYRLFRLAMAWKVARKAPHLTAVSPDVGEHFRRYLCYRKKIYIVPNGLPDDCFAQGPKTARGDRELVYAATLTGWGKLKNAGVALEAFALVKRELPGARLLLFGYGHGAGGPAHQWAQARGLVDGVEFAGQVPHQTLVARLRQEADVFLHPSREECCPLAVLEAMALGLPVIGGRSSGGVPFVLDYGKAGILTDVTSSTAVAQSMLMLARDVRLRQERSRAAWEKADKAFRINTIVSSYTQLYELVYRAKAPAV